MNVVYGCCVGSWDKFQRNVAPRTAGRRVVATSGHSGIAAAYNMIIEAVARWKVDALVLLHDDLEITDPNAEEKFLAALAEPDVALVGVAGARDIHSLAWWEGATVGHQLTDAGLIDFGSHAGDVTALDGSIIVMSPWAVECRMWFDARYMGFHGYDCDIAKTARLMDKRVVVADVDTHHHTELGFKSDESSRAWDHANTLFREKWNL